jgi:hypothetical protein
MSEIKISQLNVAGEELFQDSESYLHELTRVFPQTKITA